MTYTDVIRTDGLLRCCVQAIRDREEPGREGDRFECSWCFEPIIFLLDAWMVDEPRPITDGSAGRLGVTKETTFGTVTPTPTFYTYHYDDDDDEEPDA